MKDPLRNLPGYALRRASAAMMARFAERIAPLELRFTEATVLVLVRANPGIAQTTIGQLLDIQRANMTPIITRLEKRGLLDRRRLDGRTNGLHLTDEGGRVAKEVRIAMDAHEAELIARVPAGYREGFVPALLALWD
jgi:DNA-binding MarR family transcriptional regulator